jgi:hypothetical protein
MPPKGIEGPKVEVLTTDEEWAMVHGEECSEAVKGFLHAALCTSGLRCWWLRSQECRSRQSVSRRHGLHSGGTPARSISNSLPLFLFVQVRRGDLCRLVRP